eukprot:243408-Prymnesium_polylepis.1
MFMIDRRRPHATPHAPTRRAKNGNGVSETSLKSRESRHTPHEETVTNNVQPQRVSCEAASLLLHTAKLKVAGAGTARLSLSPGLDASTLPRR